MRSNDLLQITVALTNRFLDEQLARSQASKRTLLDVRIWATCETRRLRGASIRPPWVCIYVDPGPGQMPTAPLQTELFSDERTAMVIA